MMTYAYIAVGMFVIFALVIIHIMLVSGACVKARLEGFDAGVKNTREISFHEGKMEGLATPKRFGLNELKIFTAAGVSPCEALNLAAAMGFEYFPFVREDIEKSVAYLKKQLGASKVNIDLITDLKSSTEKDLAEILSIAELLNVDISKFQSEEPEIKTTQI